jgi:hypothetical protein
MLKIFETCVLNQVLCYHAHRERAAFGKRMRFEVRETLPINELKVLDSPNTHRKPIIEDYFCYARLVDMSRISPFLLEFPEIFPAPGE